MFRVYSGLGFRAPAALNDRHALGLTFMGHQRISVYENEAGLHLVGRMATSTNSP